MKTIAQLKQLIEKNSLEILELKKKKYSKPIARAIDSLKSQNQYTKEIIMYLETCPDENILINEKNRLTEKINTIMEKFFPPENISKKILAEHQKIYENLYNVPTLRRQLKNINYILTDEI